MSFPTWPPDINNITDSVFKNTILDGQVDISGTFYNRLGNVIIGDSANPDFDPSSNGITLNTTRICLGKDSSVTGDNGVAIGNSATTGLQENSISIGYNSIVDASNSVAIGPDASANGLNSIALGYNSGTGSYTNSVALGANSTVGANDVISLGDGTQKVGIGTTSPDNKLTIAGGAIQLNPFANGSKKFAIYSDSDKLQINPRTAAGGYENTVGLIMNSSGYVGIGTTNPVHYFELGNVTTVYHTYNGYAHNTSNATSLEFNNVNNAHIVNAYIQRLGTQYVFFLSDRRLKKDIVDIHDDEALVDLRKLQPRKYKYIDQFTRTSNEVYGFIAQEVGEVLPNAINLDTQTIPNVYEIGHVSENIITLSNKTTIDLSLNKIIRLITETKDVNTKIVEIIDDKQFKVEETFETSDIFIYGTQEDDVNIIDKNAIFTVATAALQEVDRQLQAEKVKTATLETKVATLETQITDLLARVTALENP